MDRKTSGWLRCALVFTAFAVVACDDEFLLEDVSFDKWCGDELCFWTVDSGKIRQVATWHKEDTGVELVGSGAQISQVSRSRSVDCIAFELISDVQPGARVVIELDFNDDGTVDFENVLPAQRWTPSEFQIRAPTRYHGFRLSVRKQGAGRAVVAQLGVHEDLEYTCAGKPLSLEPQGEGAACESDDECEAGCVQNVCTTCEQEGTCDPDMLCEKNSQCDGAGGCEDGFCSECDTDEDCDGDTACALRWPQIGLGPKVCE